MNTFLVIFSRNEFSCGKDAWNLWISNLLTDDMKATFGRLVMKHHSCQYVLKTANQSVLKTWTLDWKGLSLCVHSPLPIDSISCKGAKLCAFTSLMLLHWLVTVYTFDCMRFSLSLSLWLFSLLLTYVHLKLFMPRQQHYVKNNFNK